MRQVFDDHDAELGIRTKVHTGDGKTVIQKTFDAEPMLEHAANVRALTAGERWGEGRIVGSVPMAVVGQFMRQDGGLDTKRLSAWLKDNPAFIQFDKFKQ